MSIFFENSYANNLTDALVSAGVSGWLPADLRHEFGHAVKPYLFAAAPRVAEQTEGTVQNAWLTDVEPAVEDHPDREKLWDMYREAILLPAFGDHTIVTDDGLTDAYLDSLTPSQLRIHRKITALLKKAESTNFAEEAETLIAKAAQLRENYRLKEMRTATASGEKATAADGTPMVSKHVYLTGTYIRHQHILLTTIAGANGCSTIMLRKSGITTVVGAADDVAHTVDMFKSLLRQCLYYMTHGPRADYAKKQKITAQFRRSFILSYTHRIGEILTESTAAAQREEIRKYHNLPVAYDRAQVARATLEDCFPVTRSIQLSASSAHGWTAGRAAANRSHTAGDAHSVQGRPEIGSPNV